MNATTDLLSQYARILNQFGPESTEAKEFVEQNRVDDEFVELAMLSRKLKEALTAPRNNNRQHA